MCSESEKSKKNLNQQIPSLMGNGVHQRSSKVSIEFASLIFRPHRSEVRTDVPMIKKDCMPRFCRNRSRCVRVAAFCQKSVG